MQSRKFVAHLVTWSKIFLDITSLKDLKRFHVFDKIYFILFVTAIWSRLFVADEFYFGYHLLLCPIDSNFTYMRSARLVLFITASSLLWSLQENFLDLLISLKSRLCQKLITLLLICRIKLQHWCIRSIVNTRIFFSFYVQIICLVLYFLSVYSLFINLDIETHSMSSGFGKFSITWTENKN